MYIIYNILFRFVIFCLFFHLKNQGVYSRIEYIYIYIKKLF